MTKEQITMHFGGGCLFLKCHKCNMDVGAEEVSFPGTPEQQKEPREKLKRREEEHSKKCH